VPLMPVALPDSDAVDAVARSCCLAGVANISLGKGAGAERSARHSGGVRRLVWSEAMGCSCVATGLRWCWCRSAVASGLCAWSGRCVVAGRQQQAPSQSGETADKRNGRARAQQRPQSRSASQRSRWRVNQRAAVATHEIATRATEEGS
jgi:hypothetical protein